METETIEPPAREGVRVFFSNLPFTADYETVVTAISKHARLIDLHIPDGENGNKNKGWAIGRVPAAQADQLLSSVIMIGPRIARAQKAR